MWWEEEIDHDTALQFLNECRAYTAEMILKYLPDIKAKQFNTPVDKVKPFMSVGAVVHSSKTKTVWDALRVIASGSHGTHFVITNHKAPARYPLMSEMPSAILCPMNFEQPAPGNSYLSSFTWSIDLRHIGKVRPWFSPFNDGKPSPIFKGEEGADFFKYTGKPDPSFFWWDNLWRAEFKGHVREWYDFYYELSTLSQMSSLVVLLRTLNAYNEDFELDRRLIVPSNCVGGGENPFPHINWSLIRRLVFAESVKLRSIDFEDTFPNTDISDEWTNNERRDEGFIAMHTREHMWRTDPDDGDIHFLLQGDDVKWPTGKQHYKDALQEFGYDHMDMAFAARMFAIAYGIRHTNVQDVPGILEKKLDKLKGL